MDNEQFKKYNDGRNEIIDDYRKKKIKNSLLILLITAILVTLIILLRHILNIAVTIVSSVMIIMIAIIFTRIRIVTLEHTKQTQLRFYEQNEPIFHTEFKR